MNIENRSAEQRKEKQAPKKTGETALNADPVRALTAKYAQAYPDCKAFHTTTDKQVFLEKDKNFAQYHQNGLGECEVRTINVR